MYNVHHCTIHVHVHAHIVCINYSSPKCKLKLSKVKLYEIYSSLLLNFDNYFNIAKYIGKYCWFQIL